MKKMGIPTTGCRGVQLVEDFAARPGWPSERVLAKHKLHSSL
jgi:hypothetical protein